MSSGAAGAVVLAAALSPLTPVGEARLATADPGAVSVDPLVTLIGVPAVVAAVLLLSVWPAIRHARPARPDPLPPTGGLARSVVRAVAAAGAPPSVLIGVRYALERGRGRPAVPVGSALLGTVLAVAALSATAVFGASLTWLVHTPALYGVPYDVNFANEGTGSGAVLTGALLHSLQRDRAIDRVTVATEVEIKVNGQHVRAVAVSAERGPALISAVDGRLPRPTRTSCSAPRRCAASGPGRGHGPGHRGRPGDRRRAHHPVPGHRPRLVLTRLRHRRTR